MKALVTGGSGFIGRGVVESLIKRGDQVTVLGRKEYPKLKKIGVKIIQADLANTEAVENACQGVDSVFHIGALTGIWGKWPEYYQTNVLGTQNILSGCRKYEVPKLIYTSSPSVVYSSQDQINIDESTPYPTESEYLCHYPKSKAMAEKMVLAANDPHKLLTIALRPHLVLGPGDTNLLPRLIVRASKGKLIRVGDGKNLVDLTYIDNVVHAHLLAEETLSPHSSSAGQAFFISQGEPVILWDWIDSFLEKMGLPKAKKSISLTKAKKVGWFMEKIYQIGRLKTEPPMTRFIASQLGTSHSYSINKAKKYLNYKPLISLEEGTQRLVDYYLKN